MDKVDNADKVDKKAHLRFAKLAPEGEKTFCIFLFGIIFITCGLVSCQENSNIVLTDFTKELISMYINDTDNFEAKNRKEEIIIRTHIDSLNYYLLIHSNDCKFYKYCRDDFVGQTLYLGHLVRVFGYENLMFYSVTKKANSQKKCKKKIEVLYDPNVWKIYFNKDQSFCKTKSCKGSEYEDISAIQNLVEKYFGVTDDNVPAPGNVPLVAK